ncbi:hypothetical protein JF540_24070 [Salipiger thiooxidans]|uniref:hypothetical protein n=1 Tax=Salipiger thiooxidans TaxID=282683 RepID=UPI001A8C30B2|nr:hypothetical protein [Salipiger thiooxidans]MBN8189769.1 hypothetical protein [Salipiger thiooxidans]
MAPLPYHLTAPAMGVVNIPHIADAVRNAAASVLWRAAQAQLRLKLPRKLKKSLGNLFLANSVQRLFEIAPHPDRFRVRCFLFGHPGAAAEVSFVICKHYTMAGTGSDHFRRTWDTKWFVVSPQHRKRALTLPTGSDPA